MLRGPGWYDILDLSHPREVNWETVAASQRQIESLMAGEPAPKMILAGFSQGAAGYAPTFKSYAGLGHSVGEEELRDVFEWLSECGS